LISGSLLNPAFWLSVSGSAAAVLTMTVVRRFAEKIFSVIGVGLWGALAHLLAQLAVAGALIVRDTKILILLPTMLLSSVLTGLIVGYASRLILEHLVPQPMHPQADEARRAFVNNKKEFPAAGTEC